MKEEIIDLEHIVTKLNLKYITPELGTDYALHFSMYDTGYVSGIDFVGKSLFNLDDSLSLCGKKSKSVTEKDIFNYICEKYEYLIRQLFKALTLDRLV